MIEDIYTIEVPFRGTYRLQRLRFGQGGPRLVVVGGLHGNELNSIYALNLLAGALRAQAPAGTVDLIPMANAFGIEEGNKLGPFDDQDLNQCFPGDADGTAMQRVAQALFQASCADVCVDLHSGSSLVEQLPQVRLSTQGQGHELARSLGLPLVWRRQPRPGNSNQLVDCWRTEGCTAFRITGGRGATLDKRVGACIADALRRLMGAMGMSRPPAPSPVLADVTDERMVDLRCGTGGFFVPEVAVADRVEEGNLLGRIVAPVGGETLEEVTAPCSGMVVTSRLYPMVHAQELLLRLVVVDGG